MADSAADPTGSRLSDPVFQTCPGCQQEIDVRAQVCRFCKAPLRHSGTFRHGRTVKWIAAAVTVFSLISGVRSLTGLWLQWQDEQAAVASSRNAARLMAQTDQFDLAWAQLDLAAGLVGEPEILADRVEVSMRWLRWLGNQRMREQDYFATAERLLPFLYQGLTRAVSEHQQDVRAHIAWANYLKSLTTPIDVDPFKLLEQVLREDPDNLYGHSMLAFLKARRDGYPAFDEIVVHFEQAHAAGDSAWAKRLRLSTLSGLLEDAHRRKAPIEQSSKIVEYYLAVAAKNPRAHNHSSAFASWLFSLDDAHLGALDDLVDALEPELFLELLPALYRNRLISARARYLFARLEEQRGNVDAALAHLHELTKPGYTLASNALGLRVRAALQRMGAATPAVDTASARGYLRDQRPAGVAPWRFHADTLLHFDLAWHGENLRAAFKFIDQMTAPLAQDIYPEMLATLRQSRDRAKAHVDAGERWLLQAGPSANIESTLAAPRWSLSVIWYLSGHVASVNRDWDVAITEWTDVYSRLDAGVTLDWELAVGHASRAALQPDGSARQNRDTERANYYLSEYIMRLRRERQSIRWNEIRSEPAFASVRSSAAFTELLRGRP